MPRKPSNRQLRLATEKSQQLISPDQVFTPGDQVLVSISHGPGETSKVWGYVLKAKRVEGKVPIVVDAVVVINRDLRFQPESCVSVDQDDIICHIPAEGSGAMLSIQVIEGEIISIRRIDGQRSPIIIELDEDGDQQLYSVTHQREQRV